MVNIFYDIETTGLEAINHKIICIVMKKENNDYLYLGEDEIHILTQFWSNIAQEDVLIGFNSDNFDLPFIITRSVVNNVKIGKFSKSIDVRKLITGFNYSYNSRVTGTLGDWAKALNLIISTENGSKMPEYYEKKEWNKIESHCKEDVLVLEVLYNRCKEVGLG